MKNNGGNGNGNGSRRARARAARVERVVGLLMGIGALVAAASMARTEHVQMANAGLSVETMGPQWAVLISIVGLVLANAYFVGAETAIELLRPLHVKHLKETDGKRSERLQDLLDDQTRHVAACALGSQIARLGIVLLTLMLAPSLLTLLGDRFGWAPSFGNLLLAGLILMAPVGMVHLVFGELVPKSYAVLHPHRVAAMLYPVIRVSSAMFSLPAMGVAWLAGLLTSRFGGKATFSIPNAAEEEILTLVETAEESGEIESEERELLRSVFDFTDTVVREVMTPRVDLDALSVRSDPMEVVSVVRETGHSRIPLYEDTDDQIVGVIHAKDLLLAMLNGQAPNLRSLMRPPLFVPENKNLYELITEMRLQRTQLAVVQDEFGGTAGIVTIEDIVEELVGEIVDEYDYEEPAIVEVEGGWLIDGKTHVDDVKEAVGVQLDAGEFDTVGGYVFGLFGRQPKQDESVETDGVRFTVVETDGRRIARLLVVRLEQPAEELEPTEASRD